MKRNKYIITIMATFAVMFSISSCKNKTTPNVATLSDSTIDENVVDTTIYGTCGDGSAMHTLQLITDGKDTLEYFINDDSETKGTRVLGGLLAGDKMAVTAFEQEGEKIASQIINLTTLLGHWQSIDKDFEIGEGGTIKNLKSEDKSGWNSWKILNGKLIVGRDSFLINNLGPDSLLLENNNGIFVYKRISNIKK